MSFTTPADGARRDLALVAYRHLQFRRLPDDAQQRRLRSAAQHLHQAMHADATDFLIVRKREMQRCFQIEGLGLEARRNRSGDETFHVSSPSPIQAAILPRHRKGRYGPDLPIDWNYIGVPRQHHARRIASPDRRKKISLPPIRARDDREFDFMRLQEFGNKLNKSKVRIGTDCWKRDQPFKQLDAFHSKAPLQPLVISSSIKNIRQ